MHTIFTGGGYFWLSMWGGSNEVLLDCELHRKIKAAEADVGLNVGLIFSKTTILLKINNNFSRNGGD